MQIKTLMTTLILGLAAVTTAAPVLAEETGLATSLHSTRVEGGRLCLSDHSHDGEGSGGSKKQAEASAIQAWSKFTSFEYGNSWGSFGNAASKSMRCAGSGSSWNCHVEARPCRSGGGSPMRKVRKHART